MSPFKQFIDKTSDDTLRKFIEGKLSLACDEQSYEFHAKGLAYSQLSLSKAKPREQLIDNETEVLTRLFLTNPLCRAEFDYQAAKLIGNAYADFCEQARQAHRACLMIEAHQLIKITAPDPRMPYGYFYQSETPLTEPQAKQAIQQWLHSGEAFNSYRSKTHCLYTCR